MGIATWLSQRFHRLRLVGHCCRRRCHLLLSVAENGSDCEARVLAVDLIEPAARDRDHVVLARCLQYGVCLDPLALENVERYVEIAPGVRVRNIGEWVLFAGSFKTRGGSFLKIEVVENAACNRRLILLLARLSSDLLIHEIGGANVRTPVINALIVCSLPLEKPYNKRHRNIHK